MSFAVVELVESPLATDLTDDSGSLGMLKRYTYKVQTDPKDTWMQANEDFINWKLKNPTKIKVEVRNLDELPQFIFLP